MGWSSSSSKKARADESSASPRSLMDGLGGPPSAWPAPDDDDAGAADADADTLPRPGDAADAALEGARTAATFLRGDLGGASVSVCQSACGLLLLPLLLLLIERDARAGGGDGGSLAGGAGASVRFLGERARGEDAIPAAWAWRFLRVRGAKSSSASSSPGPPSSSPSPPSSPEGFHTAADEEAGGLRVPGLRLELRRRTDETSRSFAAAGDEEGAGAVGATFSASSGTDARAARVTRPRALLRGCWGFIPLHDQLRLVASTPSSLARTSDSNFCIVQK